MSTADDYYVYRRSEVKLLVDVLYPYAQSVRSLPGIDVVCDSGKPAPEGCRRPHPRRVAPERTRSC